MASIDDILRKIDELRYDMTRVIQELRINAAQIIVGDLSQISGDLGLVKAGEFRSGVGIPGDPGTPFTGVRIGYPGFIYVSQVYNIVGLDNDTLQFGLRASDGVAIFAGGAARLDNQGLNFRTTEGGTPSFIIWRDTDDVYHGYQGLESTDSTPPGWLLFRALNTGTPVSEKREFQDWLYWYNAAEESTSIRTWTMYQIGHPDTSASTRFGGFYTYWKYQYDNWGPSVIPFRIRPYGVEVNPDGYGIGYMAFGQSSGMATSDGADGKGKLYMDENSNLMFVSPDGVAYQLNTT